MAGKRGAVIGRTPTQPDIVDQDWMAYANCLEVDTQVFFPGKTGSTKEAKAICADCAVREECLEYALAFGDTHGIWGGTSERERRAIKRRRKAAAKAALRTAS